MPFIAFSKIKNTYLALTLSLISFSLFGQNTVQSDSSSLNAIPADQIPLFYQNVSNLEIEISKLSELPDEISELDTLINNFVDKLSAKNQFLIDSVNYLKLNSLNNEFRYWTDARNTTTKWNETISNYLIKLQDKQVDLKTLSEQAKLTSSGVEEGSLPEEMISMLSYSTKSLKSSKGKIDNALAKTLKIQAKLTPTISIIDDSQNRINQARDEFLFHIWLPEQPPIWEYDQEFRSQFSSQDFSETFNAYWKENLKYWNENRSYAFFITLLFILLSFYINYIKKHEKDITASYPSVKSGRNLLFKYPFPSSILMIFVFILLTADAPGSVGRFLALVSAIPASIILYRNAHYSKELQVTAFLLFVIFMESLYLIDDIARYRLLLLLMAPILGGFAFYVYRRTKHFFKVKKSMKYFLEIIFQLFFLISIVSFVANIIGSVEFAFFLFLNAITSVVLGTYLYLGAILSYDIFTLLLTIPPLNKSNIVSNFYTNLTKYIERGILIFTIYLWVIYTLQLFNLRDNLESAVISFFTSELVIGEISLSLINVLSFFLIIMLSIWISKLVRFILKEEFVSRMDTPDESMFGTIYLVIRYSVITLGVVFAFAAAGINLNKITVLIGALGVGIGFGLQNIFNNLVSGVILAFERPMKVGDVVFVAGEEGVVKDIGFRASIIRTWSGAEIIVPNGDLLSSKMVNWTLSDKRKRYSVDLTVVHGTDPSKVLDLLRTTATENSDVLKNPSPIPRFLGVNEYGMSFQLLFWLPDVNNGFGPRTQVNTDIYRNFLAEGIDIQYAKVDVHLNDKNEPLIPPKSNPPSSE